MPRARISKNGVELALPGYDVDTAPLSKMLLTPQFPTMRIALSRTVTVGSYSGPGDTGHDRAVVNFADYGLTFPSPPLVLVSGIIDANTSDQTPFSYTYTSDGGRYWIDMHHCIETTTTGFTLYVMKTGFGNRVNPPRTWKYFVFANRGG